MFFPSTLPFSEGAESAGETVTGDAPVVPEAKNPELEAKPAVRNLKVNGKEVSLSEDQWDKYLQLGLAATEKFQEASKKEAEAQKIIAAAKDGKSALKALELAGHSKAEAKAILEKELLALYEEEDLSPEERARREEKAELERYKSEEAQRKAKIEAEASSKEEQAYLEKLDAEIADAVESIDLPKHPIFGKMALNYMSSFMEKGQDLSAKEAMQFVASDFKGIIREVLSGMDAKAVKQYLKADHLKGLQDEVLSNHIAKQKPFDKPAVVSKQAEEKPVDKTQVGFHRSKDFFNNFSR